MSKKTCRTMNQELQDEIEKRANHWLEECERLSNSELKRLLQKFEDEILQMSPHQSTAGSPMFGDASWVGPVEKAIANKIRPFEDNIKLLIPKVKKKMENARFHREMELVARLRHPNQIAPIRHLAQWLQQEVFRGAFRLQDPPSPSMSMIRYDQRAGKNLEQVNQAIETLYDLPRL